MNKFLLSLIMLTSFNSFAFADEAKAINASCVETYVGLEHSVLSQNYVKAENSDLYIEALIAAQELFFQEGASSVYVKWSAQIANPFDAETGSKLNGFIIQLAETETENFDSTVYFFESRRNPFTVTLKGAQKGNGGEYEVKLIAINKLNHAASDTVEFVCQ